MFELLPGSPQKGTSPLFYRKKMGANGESEELCVGSCVVSLVTGLIVLTLAGYAIFLKVDPLIVFGLLLKQLVK